MLDTREDKLDRYHELLREQAPYARLAQAMRLSRNVRELALAGIAMRHPGASEQERRVRLAVRLYGRDLAQARVRAIAERCHLMAESTPADDAIDVALRVAAAIELAGGSYFVGGSLASSLQGEPRATNDIDIVLTLPLGKIASFVQALGADFEVDVDMLRDALLHGQSANIFYLPRF
jgi:hypothetical protein